MAKQKRTTHILEPKHKEVFSNTKVIAPGMYKIGSTSSREPYGLNDMIHNIELEIARKQALLSKDMPLEALMYSLTPPPVEKKPNGSKNYKNKNPKKYKLIQHDQATKSPNADLLFDPGFCMFLQGVDHLKYDYCFNLGNKPIDRLLLTSTKKLHSIKKVLHAGVFQGFILAGTTILFWDAQNLPYRESECKFLKAYIEEEEDKNAGLINQLILQKQESLTVLELQCEYLQEVDLTDCESLTNSVFKFFSDGGGCPMLKSLVLDSCVVCDIRLMAVVGTMKDVMCNEAILKGKISLKLNGECHWTVMDLPWFMGH
ncbi:Leucine-rich repeat, cysteine-containing subtype [Artemisia annua]|uniref:Leucine-rich repeat, cysteine-containing subtype n=1 Tax=Artemisia annua TaxID=35608 RepID=A0A2U1QE64_ARTAN|nr:Leucine-rich repeat, cysteine-containing subtype [Artemisia annua]